MALGKNIVMVRLLREDQPLIINEQLSLLVAWPPQHIWMGNTNYDEMQQPYSSGKRPKKCTRKR